MPAMDISAQKQNPQISVIRENRVLILPKQKNIEIDSHTLAWSKSNTRRFRNSTTESWPGTDRRSLYKNNRETKDTLSETSYNDYKTDNPPSDKRRGNKTNSDSKITGIAYTDSKTKNMGRKNDATAVTLNNDKSTKQTQQERKLARGKKREPTPEKLPEISNEKEKEFYPRGFIPAAYTVHRPVATPRQHRDEDLSTVTKLDIIDGNKQLIYKETQITKAKVEKLKAIGAFENDVYLKLKKTKEEKRWDLLHKSLHDKPKTVHQLWEFLRTEYRDLHGVLQQQYTAAIRLHFQPRLTNLKSTPGNLLKMSDILLEITEEYDVRVRELERSITEKDRQLDAARKTLNKTKSMVLSWGQRDLTEDDSDDTRQIAQEIYDVITDIAQEKDGTILQQTEENEELKKKVGRLTKVVKEKEKKMQDMKQVAEVASQPTGSRKGSQLSLNRRPEASQGNEEE